MGGVGTFRCIIMSLSEEKLLRTMPKLRTDRVERLVEDILGCRWTVTVLRAVSSGVNRPGALERHIEGISPKVLNDRLKHFTRSGLFERIAYAEIPPRVEYRLTSFGRKFMRLLSEIDRLQKELDALNG
jgi:DNA-binding HxlR family transcriptional regulator